jgi:hypothetical protein
MCEGEDVVHLRLVEREALSARMKLDPTGATVEATHRLAKRIGMRIEPAEGNQPPRILSRLREDAIVGLRIPVRLLRGEHNGPCADWLERRQQFLDRASTSIGVIAARVGVGVEQGKIRKLGEQRFEPSG